MVANPSNYRRPIVSSHPAMASFACIESLRGLIRRGTEAAFLIRGYDRSFCEAVTDEAMLAIHAYIDEYSYQSDFRAWAVAIAIRVGFEKIRKPSIPRARINQAELPQNSEADTSKAATHADGNGNQQAKHLELAPTHSHDTTGQKLRTVQEPRHREMVRGILGGNHPADVAQELKLSADFQRIFLSEAIRKMRLLLRHSETTFSAATGLR